MKILTPFASSLLLVLAACASTPDKGAPDENPPDASAAPDAAPAAAEAEAKPAEELPSPSSIDSLLSEDAFKALHQLKGEAAPAPRGETIDLDGARAYLSLPAGEGPHPGIVVIHEWWGLNDHIRHWADRLAEDGYAALAVDLYGGNVAENRDDAMKYMKSVDDAAALATLERAHAFLVEDARIQAPATGVIGWCFGGGWSLRTALAVPELDAAVIYYGRLVTDPAQLKKINASLLGVFANQDQGIPPAEVDEFGAGLKAAGVDYMLLRFDANHAFANPSSDRYDPSSAETAWGTVRSFLKHHLKGG